MDPFEAIALIGAFSVIGMTVFATTRAIANAWSRRVGAPLDDYERLLEVVERLETEVRDLKDSLAYRVEELEERVDFSERLLSKEPSRRDDSRSRVIGLTPI